MRTLLVFLAALAGISANAYRYSYSFDNTPISEALVRICKDHPEDNISFIYKELDSYTTSSKILTDDLYTALRQTVGQNPVSVIDKGCRYFVEALQHGKFRFHGRVVDAEGEPLVGAAVTLLSPRDSSVVTFGITDSIGKFSIPCDTRNVLAKFACAGYQTLFMRKPDFSLGSVKMQQTPINLSTVFVEADNTLMSTDKNTYIPTSSQKKASQNATDLLRRMAIPQLVITPGDNSVKDVFGNNVALFINYHEALGDELRGMNMADVRKIEYIAFPTDPRFKGEQRVVNIIVQEYEYGGYTKALESFRCLNGLYNDAEVFSRFAYKRMTYELFAGAENQSFHHSGSDNTSVIQLQEDGEPVKVTRTETFKESDTHSRETPVTLRASYYSPKFSVRNLVSFTHNSKPVATSSGDLDVDSHRENDFIYSRSNPERSNSVYFKSDIWGVLNSKASFDINPSFSHTHRNTSSLYESSLLSSPIFNNITENTYNVNVQASARMVLNKTSQLSLFLGAAHNAFRLNYEGSVNALDSYSTTALAGDLRYRYQSRRLSFSAFAGFGFDHNSMNGHNNSDAYPRFGCNAWVSLNQHSQISANISYYTSTPGISLKANDVVQSNEFIYLTGNPNLKNWNKLTSNLAYNWFLNNSFSMAAFGAYDQDFDRVATIYVPYNIGAALLRDFINNGDFRHYYFGVSANYKLLNNNLQLYANITQHAYEISGNYPDTFYPIRIQLQAAYYWRNFSVLASWGNPQRSLTENSNYKIRGRNFHMFSLGWGNGSWTVNIAAKNIFNKGWHADSWSKDTPLYAENIQYYNPSAHPSLQISATYTISYGKKIKQGNEVRGQGASESAIIK